jgi:hypothetical protein
MLFYEICEARVDDLLVTMRRAKDQLARLAADRNDLNQRRLIEPINKNSSCELAEVFSLLFDRFRYIP